MAFALALVDQVNDLVSKGLNAWSLMGAVEDDVSFDLRDAWTGEQRTRTLFHLFKNLLDKSNALEAYVRTYLSRFKTGEELTCKIYC